jgi:hypothetical protein
MTPAQRRAVERHRKQQARKGNVRLELTVPAKDRDLLRQVAARLREDDIESEHLRVTIQSVLDGEVLVDFKKYLELAPLEELDLERDRDSTIRDIEW